MAEGDPPAVKIVRRELYGDGVPLDDLDKEFAHLAGNMGEDEMIIIESNPKEGVRQYFYDLSRELNGIGSLCSWWSRGRGSFRTSSLWACISHAEPPENKKAQNL